jgi:hypothetical protein
VRIAAALVVLLLPAVAHAHGRSASYSRWQVDDRGATVRLELSRLAENAVQVDRPELFDPDRLAHHLASLFTLERAGAPCAVTDARPLASSAASRRFEWRLRCAGGADADHRLRAELLFDRLAGHVHVASIQSGDSGGAVDHVLSAGSRTVSWRGPPEPAAPLDRLASYVVLGARHVWSGADHLVFLLALVIVAGSLRELATVVTGFTVGHSVTLALAVTGVAAPDGAAIEALIGLSIVVVAVENGWLHAGASARAPIAAVALIAILAAAGGGAVPAVALVGCTLFAGCYFPLAARTRRPARARAGLAALFGLVHGFGFAAVLSDLTGHEPDLALPLVGFNAGVELGQLALIAGVWPLIVLLRKAGAHRLTIELGSAAAATAGIYWFVIRALG